LPGLRLRLRLRLCLERRTRYQRFVSQYLKDKQGTMREAAAAYREHSDKHMGAMDTSMEQGRSVDEAHDDAMEQVGGAYAPRRAGESDAAYAQRLEAMDGNHAQRAGESDSRYILRMRRLHTARLFGFRFFRRMAAHRRDRRDIDYFHWSSQTWKEFWLDAISVCLARGRGQLGSEIARTDLFHRQTIHSVSGSEGVAP
jgi:hypothetical protein